MVMNVRIARRTDGWGRGTAAALLAVAVFATKPSVARAAVVDFNRDLRPIFSDTCFKCHGPDESKRKGKLRLDVKEGALAEHEGRVAVAPGDLARSEAWNRLTTTNLDDVMPPANSGLKLTPEQIRLFGDWIRQGAKYEAHWSLVPPIHPAAPKVNRPEWVRNGIDPFVLARLEQEKLIPAPEADKATLLRRVTLDLTGLPPTPAELDAFLFDNSENAYEKVVARLLASPHYGERMAVDWLDAARFADTHGYHIDSGRDMTRWREWVIEAFNQNLPFDQFTVDQLAGDLLPNATLAQKIASGFNRNHMINFEGGAIAEEYHTAYLIDRVNTTATVWLGLTMACAQCHDHKYDPIAQKDYYRLFAFFNNVPENGLDGSRGNAEPVLPAPSPAQTTKLSDLDAALAGAESRAKTVEAGLAEAQTRWEATTRGTPAPEPAGLRLRFTLDGVLGGVNDQGTPLNAALAHTNAPHWIAGPAGRALELPGTDDGFVSVVAPMDFDYTNSFSYGAWVKHSGEGQGTILSRMDGTAELRGLDLFLADGKLMIHLIHAWPGNAIRVGSKAKIPKDAWTHVFATYDGSGKATGVRLYVNGKKVPTETLDDNLSATIRSEASFKLGKRSASQPFKGGLAEVRVYDRVLAAAEIAGLEESPNLALLGLAAAERTAGQQEALRKFFRAHHAPEWTQANAAIETARRARDDFKKTIPTTMVMAEMAQPRDTYFLMRGQYDQHGEKVTAGLPASLPPLPAGEPANRLGLARWLVSPNHPLTARVTVNRYWQMYFGTGLVKTAEDFGSQGEWPSHPELLDWLATTFVSNGWDVKRLQKLIVMSATYRQASTMTPELAARDPENRLFGHGPRLRLQAEFIRDQALAVSGLLNQDIGGQSVSPYQPPGLWEELASRADGKNWTAQAYTQSHGRDLYRRTMYTFWKRTSPPPTLSTFDAPDRETCTVRRPRTNTPLQALILLNDPTYIEAARKLAERLMMEAKGNDERIVLAFRLATGRAPKAAELRVLNQLHDDELTAYRANAANTAKLLKVGEAEHNTSLDAAELAAWTIVASTILNLDETVTKG